MNEYVCVCVCVDDGYWMGTGPMESISWWPICDSFHIYDFVFLSGVAEMIGRALPV